MHRRRFETWLHTVWGLDAGTVASRISNCERVEKFEGDLDDQFDADGLRRLMERLTYSTEDKRFRRNPKHNVPIAGNIHNGSATLKSAVKLYREFMSSARHGRLAATYEGLGPDSDSRHRGRISGIPVSAWPSLTVPRRRPSPPRTRHPVAQWPHWPQPTDEALFELAQVLAPLIRFLNPAIIATIADDSRRHRAEWSSHLDSLGIDPAIYLWDGSPCAFPGVRRYAGSKEIARFRKQSAPEALPSRCLTLDDNDYPKHVWAFVFTGRPFRKRGPDGYQLAHLIDHKVHGNRWREELEVPKGAGEPPSLFGLFTSAANAAYLPAAFLRPTDFSIRLRALVQRRALALYGDACRLVPPPLAVKACDNPMWSLDRFAWSAPVGDMAHVPAFLAFRRERINELIEQRRAAHRH